MKVILDTCILDYLLKRKSVSATSELIERLDQKYSFEEFCISEFTKFELLRGAKKIKDVTEFLKDFNKVKVTDEILTLASFLYSACQKINERKINSDGDCIIGATSFFIPGASILTADGDGFPRPFFTEITNEEISYKNKSKVSKTKIFLLKPNWRALSDGLNAHIKK